jgi:uroporphyrinogen-III synthase
MPPANWPAVAAIGPATARVLDECRLHVSLVAEKHTAEGLFEALNADTDLRGKRVLLPQSNIARPMLASKLREAGALVDVVTAYETVRPDIDPSSWAGSFDAITFTSPSTIQNFVDLFDDPAAVIGDALVAAIGPVTANTARDLGLRVDVVADPHTVEGLVMALSEAFEKLSYL